MDVMFFDCTIRWFKVVLRGDILKNSFKIFLGGLRHSLRLF